MPYLFNPSPFQLIRIYVSNDTDPSFLFSLDVADHQYGRIREEEQLLVDFGGFADKLAWLLAQCCDDGAPRSDSTHTAPSSRFRAILQAAGPASGCFKLVETNSFKDLPHLALQLRNGTDASVKQFLAFRLGEVRADCARLQEALNETLSAKESLEKELDSEKTAAAAASADYAAAAERAAFEISDLRERLVAAESSAEGLRAELAAVKAELTAALDTAAAAEATAAQLQRAKSEADVELAGRLAQLQEATARGDAAEAAAAQMAQRCQGFEAALRQAEARIEEWKGIAAVHESKIASMEHEVQELRQRAAVAGQEAAAMTQRLEERNGAAAEREKEAADLRLALSDAKRREEEALRKLGEAEASVTAAEAAAAAAATQMSELEKKAQSSDKMVAWLNKQLTALQLQAGAVARGPRGLPSSSAPPPLSAAPSAASLRYSTPPGAPMPATPSKSWPGTIAPELSAASLDSAAGVGAGAVVEKNLKLPASVEKKQGVGPVTDAAAWPQPRPPLLRPGPQTLSAQTPTNKPRNNQ